MGDEKEMKSNAIYVGGSNYVTHQSGVNKTEYETCLSQMEAEGYQKVADNGDGFDHSVFCTTFQMESRIANVTFFKKMQKMSVSIYEGPVSKRLYEQEPDIGKGSSKLHMLELFRLGNSFVFQLKNGHFVISDGGLAADLPYLLDYLESIVPEGEKPVIDGWIISHAHGDHCGALCEFTKHPEWMERVFVEGIYYSEPSEEEILSICGCEILDYEMKWVSHRLKNEDGSRARMYRPQTGQRYYFCGLTMDILLAQEQVPFGSFRKDLNTSSTVCMFTIEGQRLLFSGDIQEEGLEWMMQNYSREFFDVDFFTLNHHGMNLCREFAEYAQARFMLLTVREDVPIRNIRETKYMISKAEESFVWGDGTKAFPLPYKAGTSEKLSPREWKYHEGKERPPQNNLYTCYGKLLRGWIFDADQILFDGIEVRAGIKELLAYLKENEVKMAAFSRKTTDELKKMLEEAEISHYFELMQGTKDYLGFAQKAEQLFELGHIYKYVVVTDDLEVVRSVGADGFKTLVPTYGKEMEPELAMRRWHKFESPEKIYDFFEIKNIYFKEKHEGDLGY